MAEDIDGLRQAMQASLPERIRAVLAGYERFTADEAPNDAKGFAGWHAAAKAALVHVEVLTKLARWAAGGEAAAADSPDGEPDAGPDDGIGRLLDQARRALSEFDEAEGEGDE